MEGAMNDSAHIVKSYANDLSRLHGLLSEMGGLVEEQVQQACQAVLEGDADAATRAVELDPKVDRLETEVEQFVIRLLALRQPMAQDLRHIVAALKITGDIERIGDLAKNIAKRGLVLQQHTLPFALAGFANMARMVQQNLKSVIDAAETSDAGRALEVWRSDEGIDDLHTALFRELLTYMIEDPRNITACAHLLFIAKNLERVGDHATNIAETIYYAARGEALTEARPKGRSSTTAPERQG
jgi:phosphate transport system protein